MDWKHCMNPACRGSSASMQWRRGWLLQSGDFAVLCDNCGSAYEQSTFCEVFHSIDSGWRQCNFCGKHLHCGCIVSRYHLELQDFGGVSCINCSRHPRFEHVVARKLSIEKPDGSVGTSRIENNASSELQCTFLASQLKASKGNQVGDRRININSYEGMKQDEILPYIQQLGTSLVSHFCGGGSSSSDQPSSNKATKLDYDYKGQTNLSMTLSGPPVGNSISSPILVGPNKFRPILPMFPLSSNVGVVTGPGANYDNESMKSPITRVAMPPPPRRQGRNQQLHPRYWPRFTNQELKQICGDSNSTIVPLFEKKLTASDAGPIGRFIVPKSCAETYLPPLSVAEGLPLQIHDVKGNVCETQFRFWSNNNSRMYVLEGLSPSIQSMQLQAGDTVTFSRMEPEGKIIMGFRKARPEAPAAQSPNESLETFPHDTTTTEGSKKTEGADPPLEPPVLEKRNTQTIIGSKCKRLLIYRQDSLELKITWEEAQDLFLPPSTVSPSIVIIGDHAFEEYEEPPIIGKRSVLIVHSNRIKEEWTQCDSCSKWRKLPVDVPLPAKWDQNRCSCSAPNELTPRELDSLVQMRNNGFKKQRIEAISNEATWERESSGLETKANAALVGDNAGYCSNSRKPVAKGRLDLKISQ